LTTPTRPPTVHGSRHAEALFPTSGAARSDVEALFVHATGFCKEVWEPVVNAMDLGHPRLSALLLDQRGHGANTPHAGPYHWDELARDVLAALADQQQPVRGIGHSSGGAAIARAEVLAPGTFNEMVLIEPIIFPPPYEPRDVPLVAGAKRRRRSFDSRQDALERFASGAFSDWDAAVLALYIDNGFLPSDEGWALRCEPDVEAEFYRQGYNVDTWDRLGDISCPVTIIVGSRSDTHQPPYLTLLIERFVDARLIVLDGLGHLAPMQDPVRVAQAIGQGPPLPAAGTL